jgi:hypothetical protein
MNEFNFRVANAAPRASGFEIGQNVGDTKTTYIYSYKTKYINGKSTGQKTNVDWDMEFSIPSWVSVKYVFEGNDCKVTFTTLQENTGSSARTNTLVMKQRESGETISFPISQEPNFTYTYFLEVSNVSSTVGANIGATTTIMVQSYMTRSDGDKNQYNLTLAKGQYLLNQKFDIQIGAHPQVLSYDYSPKEDSSYRYSVQIG